MSCHDLREFLGCLEALGELQTIIAPVSPWLEIAAITDRVCKGGAANRALLFAAVAGSSCKVATNLFGSEKRVAAALGLADLAALTTWFDALLANAAGASAAEKLAALPATPRFLAAAPVMTSSPAPEQLVDSEAGLTALPLLKSHPGDGQPEHDGRFMTLPLVITAAPDLGSINCGMYRAAVVDNSTLAVSWSSSSGAAAHAADWLEQGARMPVTIALGGPPALTFSATLPLPPALDEFTFAGLLQGGPLNLYRCANGLPAPATAEAVLEGYLLPESVASGAFGNHTGGYTPSRPAAAVRITRVSCRREMILPATVVGKPPMEDCWLARAGGMLLLSLLKIDLPDVMALHLPFAGIFHGAAIISVRNAAGNGKQLLAAIRQTSWFAASRLLILVDGEQDPADEAGVCWRVMNHVDWQRDLVIAGEKLSIDATRKPGDREAVVADDETAALVARRWQEYGFGHTES
jgi:4-hydroxy-3-polyprenylbenzoate decarboxylase